MANEEPNSKKRTADGSPEKSSRRNKKQPKMDEDLIKKMLESMNRIEANQEKMSKKIDANTSELKIQSNALEKKIVESCDKVRDEFTIELKKLGDKVESDFKTQIDSMNDKITATSKNFTNELNTINKEIIICKEAIKSNENDVDRMLLMNNLKITGIPHTENENLNELFLKIASIIKYDVNQQTNIPLLRRIMSKNITAGHITFTSIIIAQFIAPHIRDAFYSKYIANLSSTALLTTDLIGFKNNSRIYIGEHLTPTNFRIFQLASALKRSNKQMQVFTKNGLVTIRLKKGDPTQIIKASRQLDEIAALNNLAPALAYTSAKQGQSTSSHSTTHTTTQNTAQNTQQ